MAGNSSSRDASHAEVVGLPLSMRRLASNADAVGPTSCSAGQGGLDGHVYERQMATQRRDGGGVKQQQQCALCGAAQTHSRRGRLRRKGGVRFVKVVALVRVVAGVLLALNVWGIQLAVRKTCSCTSECQAVVRVARSGGARKGRPRQKADAEHTSSSSRPSSLRVGW